jgi:hypothetical protein
MHRFARTLTIASGLSLGLLLSNCSSFDPTDIMDNLFAAQKKPLPGERKALFPQGTPGVPQGLPPELVKGYQSPPTEAAQDVPPASEQPKPKPKPKPKVAAAPPANPPSAAPAPARAPAPQAAPWPDAPPPRQSSAPPGGQTVWPDPPAPPLTR